ncbi:MAG: hypothetical protein AB7U83_07805 [Vicinamibacterales bacterium]
MLTRGDYDGRVRPSLAAAMSAPRRALTFGVVLVAVAIGAVMMLERRAGPLSEWWLAPPVLAFALAATTAAHNLGRARSAMRTALFREAGASAWPGASFDAEARIPREWIDRAGLFVGASEEELDGLLRIEVGGVAVAISGGTVFAKSGTGAREGRHPVFTGTLFAAGLGQGARPAVVALSPREAAFHPEPPALAGAGALPLGVPEADAAFRVRAGAAGDAARVFPEYVALALAALGPRAAGLRLVVLDNVVVGAVERPPLELSVFTPPPDFEAVAADVARIDDVLALVGEVAASPVLGPVPLPPLP